jgi:enoyl-CoA hydratase
MTEPLVLVEKEDGLAVVTLNRPQQMNALNRPLRSAIVEAFEKLRDDEDVRVVILTGAGRAFCAGLDLKELAGETDTSGDEDAVTQGADILTAMDALTQPIIGAVNGVAVTGGFEFALGCDVLIGSPEARFADTHARVGIVPGWGLSQKLPRLIGINRARELSFTGNYIGAEQAERWGLLNRVVPSDDLLDTCKALARDMLSCDPVLLRKYKQLIRDGYATTFGESMVLEKERSQEHQQGVTQEQVRERRQGIQGRGRVQVKGS